MNSVPLPNGLDLVLAKGYHDGNRFVGVGIIREQGTHKVFITNLGAKVPWGCVTSWRYLKDVAPEYDIWAPDATLQYVPSESVRVPGGRQH